MRRLSIIDLKGGHQPIHNSDRTAWIVFNGEIYNYRELRKQLEKLGHQFYTDSDTEAIVHAYDEYGIDCPKYLRGMFAFAIWDERNRALFLARDRVGKKRLQYAQVGDQLIFASEFGALMAQESSAQVKTFSIGFDEQDFSELHHAKRVAEHVGADHHEFIVRPNAMEILPTLVEHYGEPFADSSAVPSYYVSRETRAFVTVALNGDGGDETFAGYECYAAMNLARTFAQLPRTLSQGIIKNVVNALPGGGSRRSTVHKAQRFVAAASMKPLDRYLRWISAFTEEAKQDLYSAEFQNAAAGFR